MTFPCHFSLNTSCLLSTFIIFAYILFFVFPFFHSYPLYIRTINPHHHLMQHNNNIFPNLTWHFLLFFWWFVVCSLSMYHSFCVYLCCIFKIHFLGPHVYCSCQDKKVHINHLYHYVLNFDIQTST